MARPQRSLFISLVVALLVPFVAKADPPKDWTNCTIVYRGPCGEAGCAANAQTIRWKCDQGTKDDCEVNTKTCGATTTVKKSAGAAKKSSSKRGSTKALALASEAPTDGSCAYFYGTGDRNTVYIANVCSTPRLITIHWPGYSPEFMQYHVNQGPTENNVNNMRATVRRAENNSKIVKDERARTGIGEPARVHLAERAIGDSTVIEIVNDEPSLIYAEWDISIVQGGKVQGTARGGVLIPMGQKRRVSSYVPSVGQSKQVNRITAEKENP